MKPYEVYNMFRQVWPAAARLGFDAPNSTLYLVSQTFTVERTWK